MEGSRVVLFACCFVGLVSCMPFYDPYFISEMDVDREIALIGLDSPYEAQLDIPSSFEREYGGGHDAGGYSGSGYEGDKGYKTVKGSEKGKAGKHAANRQRTRYSDNGGRKAGHQDTSNYYKDKHAIEQASKGEDYLVAKHHDKGSKTTGFHNVHHKEEYNKNKKFYDEKSEHGHYRRYGDFGAGLIAASGGGQKGSHYDAGYKHADYGKDGFSDKGSLIDQLKEYAAANGYAGYGGNDYKYKKTGGLGDYKTGYYR